MITQLQDKGAHLFFPDQAKGFEIYPYVQLWTTIMDEWESAS